LRKDSSEEDERGYDSDAPAKKPADGDALKGSTPDYYNDDLSRKAVGRLFSDGGSPGRDETASDEAFVRGFSERPERHGHSERPSPPDGNPYEDDKMREHRRDKFDRYDKHGGKGPDKGHNPGGKPGGRPERPGGATPQPSPAVRVGQYRAGASVGKAPQNPGRVMSGDSPYPSGKRKPGPEDDGGKSPSGEDYSQYRRKYDDRDYVTSPHKRPIPTRAAAAGGPGEREVRKSDEDYDEPENSGLLKVVFGALVVIFLVVLAILVFRINSVSAQLRDARQKLEDAPNYTDYNDIKLSNDQLTASNADLQKQVDDLTAQLAAAQSGVAVSAPPAASAAPGATQAPSGGTASADWPKPYTVVSGDSLSKIAKHFYGNSSQANIDKIKTYNSLTSDNINVGAKLQIPE